MVERKSVLRRPGRGPQSQPSSEARPLQALLGTGYSVNGPSPGALCGPGMGPRGNGGMGVMEAVEE